MIDFKDNNELLDLVNTYCNLIIKDDNNKSWIRDMIEIVLFEGSEANYNITIACTDSIGLINVKDNNYYVEDAFKFILSSSKPFTYPRFEDMNITINYVVY